MLHENFILPTHYQVKGWTQKYFSTGLQYIYRDFRFIYTALSEFAVCAFWLELPTSIFSVTAELQVLWGKPLSWLNLYWQDCILYLQENSYFRPPKSHLFPCSYFKALKTQGKSGNICQHRFFQCKGNQKCHCELTRVALLTNLCLILICSLSFRCGLIYPSSIPVLGKIFLLNYRR